MDEFQKFYDYVTPLLKQYIIHEHNKKILNHLMFFSTFLRDNIKENNTSVKYLNEQTI